MPASLVSRIGQRNTLAEYKSVLNDAQNQVVVPVDAASMARELAESGGREYVEMVRALSTDLANARKELEAANQRYERLVADLARRGIPLTEDPQQPEAPEKESAAAADERDEWEIWDQRFKALLG